MSTRAEKLRKMLEADPADSFVLYALAQEEAKAGRHAEAVELYDRCLAVDEAYCYAYYHKAVSQEAMGARAEAAATAAIGAEVARRVGDGKALNELLSLRAGYEGR